MRVSKRSMIVGGSISVIGALATAAAFSQGRTFALAVSRDAGCSPGMEVADRRRDAFAVFAFRADGARTVFANYPARV